MPDSGKVHVVMSFEPMSAVPDNMHFVESYDDRGWKIFNIRASKHAAAKAWDELTYCDDPDLPISYFCDDSTTVNVKILNYIPEAARNIRFTYDKVDFGGEVVDGERYPISADGTATIKLHPCFPISAFMSLGDGPSALIMLMPGKDITVLIDMDEAKDGLGIKGFEGAYAKMHYEINVEGGKDWCRTPPPKPILSLSCSQTSLCPMMSIGKIMMQYHHRSTRKPQRNSLTYTMTTALCISATGSTTISTRG